MRDELRHEKNMYMGVARMCEAQRLKCNVKDAYDMYMGIARM